VDQQATRNARVERMTGGSLPPDNLREAVWMIVLRDEVEKLQKRATYYPLPPGMNPEFAFADRESSTVSGGFWGSTAQTVLAWRWVVPAGPSLEGILTWPDSSDPAEAHAASLLHLAEEGLSEGCVPSGWPRAWAPAAPRLTARPLDAYREWFDDLDAHFRIARDKWIGIPRCR
jgi:hypothetical protein